MTAVPPPQLHASLDPDAESRLLELARDVRVEVVDAVRRAQGGHLGGPLSAAEILVTLYFHILRIRPDEPDWDGRDRFILSKGHSAIALYATLALRGYFPRSELVTFDAIDSRLQGHPDMRVLPGVDMSTGSLGLGLSAGVGMALGLRRQASSARVVVMLGDGECQEGSVWEAADVASRYELDRLIAVVDHNRLQQYGWEAAQGLRMPPFADGVLARRFAAFGWQALHADGHDPRSISEAFDEATSMTDRPSVIVAETVKGRGVPFMEGSVEWHARVPSDDEATAALAALRGGEMA